jgi:alpha-tubulin suppressor-like RCC1 family protein
MINNQSTNISLLLIFDQCYFASSGSNHSISVGSKDKTSLVYTQGSNDFGQLGLKNVEQAKSFTKLSFSFEGNFILVKCISNQLSC